MNPTFFRQPSRSLVARLVAGILVPALCLVSVPTMAAAPATPAPPAAPSVAVNRTVPKVDPVPLRPVFSAEPTDREIFKARVFEEPLVPVGGMTTPYENRALAEAIQAFVDAGDRLDLSPFERFLWEHDLSAWRASLRLGMGLAYLRAGRFTRAAAALQEAWHQAKDKEDAPSRAVADRALGELANLRMLFTQVTETELLLKEAKGRRMRGSAVEKLNAARAQLAMRERNPDDIRPTGALALARILASRMKGNYRPDPRLTNFRAPQYGSTLTQIEALAKEVGLNLRMAYHADKNAPIEVPSVAHLTMGHYAAVLARNEAGTRYLLDDPSFGAQWVTREALLEEVSGYFLIEGEELPEGWRAVDKADGDRILGRCTGPPPDGGTTRKDPCEGGECCGAGGPGGPPPGMATYSFHALTINLSITDTPVGYTPPRGPTVAFQVTYNHKEAGQPQTFTYSNLGSRWTFDELSFIEDDNLQALALHPRGGGSESYSNFDGQQYPSHYRSQNVVARVQLDPIVWEVRHADGSVDTYSQPDCEICSGRRVFMTESKDPAGNTVTYTYDQDLRLVAITDAIGQVTTLSYGLPQDSYRITRVTDPFGRFAQFEYSPTPDLVRITDVIGMSSQFQYGSTESDRTDFITAMTTPYGTTTFRQTEKGGGTSSSLEATDPLGGTERIAYDDHEDYVPEDQKQSPSDGPSSVPVGFEQDNQHLNIGLTHYWNKRAMALYPGDYRKAKVIRWMSDPDAHRAAGVKQSEKQPLENRVWYAYDGAGTLTYWGIPQRGTSARPTRIARVLDDGTSQVYRYEYNALGKVIRETDPVGRTKTYTYDPTGMDLLETRQVNGQNSELLWSGTYNSQHQPLTSTDASGQTTTYTYTPSGQIETVVTPARGGLSVAERTTTYEYYPPDDPVAPGRLKKVTGPSTAQGAPTTTYTYDVQGRLRTSTDPDGYTVTYDYDALDRLTRVTYPDGTYEETTYSRLDAEGHRDRLGRWTHVFHDALRRVVATRDALGRTTQYQYGGSGCPSCGMGGDKLSAVIDANGNATRWERDLQGRVTSETRADQAQWLLTYETTSSRVKTITDPKGNVKTYTYNLDNNLQGVSYAVASGTAPTANVSYTYDPVYDRLLTMMDGSGTTTYAYYPITSPATLGAGELASVDGPLASDTVLFGYDELGRIASRGLDGFASSFSYDSLGRVTTQASALGSFVYGYDALTSRPLSLSYPNGQATNYSYFPNAGDHRLQQIKHLAAGGATISQHDYTNDAVGNIATWTQQVGPNPAKLYTLGYDAANQLTSATVSGPSPLPVPSRFAYAYDAAGNRTAEQLDDAVMGASHNNRNQLMSRQAGGVLVFKGSVNEPATVSVGGKPAQVAPDDSFAGQATVPTGTSNVVVAATDPSGNTRTNTYQVSQSGATASYTYDANGNLTGDGTKTYEWDAEDRLVAISQGATLATLAYDGSGRRVQKVAGGVTHSYVYDGVDVIEERLSTGAVQRYVQGPGIDRHRATRDDGGTVTYYLADHLGSVGQTTNAAGTVTLAREYDPYGNLLTGSAAAGYAFTGREWDPETGLYYYRARYYDPKIGRFISEDPIRFRGGTNFYAYVADNPVNATDPSGLQIQVCQRRAQNWMGKINGNHAYFWDPRVHNHMTPRDCGSGSSSGNSSSGSGPGTTGYEHPDPSNTECYDVPNSDGFEDLLMICCRENANSGGGDCHAHLSRCLKQYHLTMPAGVHRFGCSGNSCGQ